MADSTYFTFSEGSPLNIPDDGSTPTTGFVSSKNIPVSPPQGEARPDQRLPGSNADGVSEKTLTFSGRITYVSWLIRDTLNKYGVTKLPPRN